MRFSRRRKQIARCYSERLSRLKQVELVYEKPGEEISWFTYTVLLTKEYSQRERDQVWSELNRAGIGCARYFAPLHRQPVMMDRSRAQGLPVTDAVAGRVFQLPFFNQITEQEIESVCEELEKALAGIG